MKLNDANKLNYGLIRSTLSLFMMIFAPTFATVLILTCNYENGDIKGTILKLANFPITFIHNSWSDYNAYNAAFKSTQINLGVAFLLYGLWIFFQAFLYIVLPGKTVFGQITPAGNKLVYNINGIRAFLITFALATFSVKLNVLDAKFVAVNWISFFIAANCYGFLVTLLAYAKAHFFPTDPRDNQFSGSMLYDLYMGVEMNPRIGSFDLKLFHNGRIGIVAWPLINLSFMALEKSNKGYVSSSSVLVFILQSIYVIDFFVYESWYIHTVDIAHERFGFYLAWGDSVWLPFMYTLQNQYLSNNHSTVENLNLLLIALIGFFGYIIFRLTNQQKDLARSTLGNCTIFNKPAAFINAKYTSYDGKTHQSLLLTSGFWGIARQFNYTGDLLLSFAMCAVCGTRSIVPWFYFIFMFVLLNHRIIRSENKCKIKYGQDWKNYCRTVPYRLVPLIY